MRQTAWIVAFTMYLSTQCRTGRCPVSGDDGLPCPFGKDVQCSEADYYKWNQYLATGFHEIMKSMPMRRNDHD